MLPTTIEENKWCLIGEFGSKHYIEFPFEFNTKINLLLKQYALVKSSIQNSTALNTQRAVKGVYTLLKMTNLLTPNKVDFLLDDIKDWEDKDKSKIPYMKEFLRFSKVENSQEFLSVLETISLPKSNSRVLPSY